MPRSGFPVRGIFYLVLYINVLQITWRMEKITTTLLLQTLNKFHAVVSYQVLLFW